MLSYWEEKNFLDHDLLVIGSGFVGLSTAIHFKKKHPKAKVLVLERGVFPSGASSKNAGFACFGSLTEILDDLESMNQDEVLSLVNKRYKGLQKIRKKFGDKKLGYRESNGYELLDKSLLSASAKMSEVNQMLADLFPKKVFTEVQKHSKLRFSDSIKMVIQNSFEGELDPGKYLNCLWKLAGELGVKVLTGANVESLDIDSGITEVSSNFTTNAIQFKAKKVAVCTNAFTKMILGNTALIPGRGLVLLSKPLEFEIPWRGGFHMDKGYIYFRQIDGRLLLGGARNIDFSGEESTESSVNTSIKSHLKKMAVEVIFPDKTIQWEKEWTGIMAFGEKKMPLIEHVSKKVAVGVRLGGMGVAVGWQVGKELAGLMAEK